MGISPLKIKGRPVSLQKCVVHPVFGARTVLTNTPWAFVGLWLKRNKLKDAALYWDQAQAFFDASVGLPIQSAPLLLYYSYMNAAKALLAARKIPLNPYHGVSRINSGTPPKKISLSSERVSIKPQGVVPGLAGYFGEQERSKTHSVQEMFLSMPYIHRTYCLTYTSQRQVFLPLKDGQFTYDNKSKAISYSARILDEVAQPGLKKILPATVRPDPSRGLPWIVSSSSLLKNSGFRGPF